MNRVLSLWINSIMTFNRGVATTFKMFWLHYTRLVWNLWKVDHWCNIVLLNFSLQICFLSPLMSLLIAFKDSFESTSKILSSNWILLQKWSFTFFLNIITIEYFHSLSSYFIDSNITLKHSWDFILFYVWIIKIHKFKLKNISEIW